MSFYDHPDPGHEWIWYTDLTTPALCGDCHAGDGHETVFLFSYSRFARQKFSEHGALGYSSRRIQCRIIRSNSVNIDEVEFWLTGYSNVKSRNFAAFARLETWLSNRFTSQFILRSGGLIEFLKLIYGKHTAKVSSSASISAKTAKNVPGSRSETTFVFHRFSETCTTQALFRFISQFILRSTNIEVGFLLVYTTCYHIAYSVRWTEVRGCLIGWVSQKSTTWLTFWYQKPYM